MMQKYNKFDLIIQTSIVISIILFSVETLPNLTPHVRKILHYSDLFIMSIFTIEYAIRIYLAKSKIKYIFSFFGIIDFLAILPIYLIIHLNIIPIKIFQTLRLFRFFKLFRFNKALREFMTAVKLIKEELIIFVICTLLLLYLSSVGIYYFEHLAQPEKFGNIFDCLWWAIITLTSVGYGNVYPITVGGKIFTFIILFIGLGIVAIPAGLFATALNATIKRKQ